MGHKSRQRVRSLPDRFESKSRHPSRLRSLTRLMLGGFEIGLDELFRQIQIWEERASDLEETPSTQSIITVEAHPVAQFQKNQSIPTVNPTELETKNTLLRYAILGWLLENQHTLTSNGEDTFRKVEKTIAWAVSPITKPISLITRSQFLSPLRRGYDRLVSRGELEVSRWIEIGRYEEQQSRRLAQVAFGEAIDETIEYLTNNPELQELVQTQSTSLANEVVEEVRERTVSADTFLEGFVRSLFRRTPRAALPEPPESVRLMATTIHPKGKIKGKE